MEKNGRAPSGSTDRNGGGHRGKARRAAGRPERAERRRLPARHRDHRARPRPDALRADSAAGTFSPNFAVAGDAGGWESPTAHEDTPMPPRLLPSLLHRLIAALRIERPWHPGLIRGGPGQLPKRIKRPRNPVSPSDTAQRVAASRAVRRLFKNLHIPMANAAPRADLRGDSE